MLQAYVCVKQQTFETEQYDWLVDWFQVRHRRDCIKPEQCPCYHNNKPYAEGQTIAVDCNTW